MDSVTSYGSGGSEEALLAPDTISFSNSTTASTRLPTSPRRTNRENLPLLRGGRVHQRLTEYEDIDSDNDNIFPGKDITYDFTGDFFFREIANLSHLVIELLSRSDRSRLENLKKSRPKFLLTKYHFKNGQKSIF